MRYYNTASQYGIILEKKPQKMCKPGASTHPAAALHRQKDPSGWPQGRTDASPATRTRARHGSPPHRL